MFLLAHCNFQGLFAQNNRVWSTYYGGTEYDRVRAVATDLSGNVFMAGISGSSNAVASGGHQNTLGGWTDGFLVKFNANGGREWGTFYGGESPDYVHDVTTDLEGNVYIAGTTHSDEAISENGFQDTAHSFINAFVAKFDSQGNRMWGTYYGGSHFSTNGYGVSVDRDGNVFLAGYTRSPDGIAHNGFQNVPKTGSNACLVKFDPHGKRLSGTYYGGDNGAFAYDVATDQEGNSFLAGYTMSETGIAYNGFQNQRGGSTDGFLVKFGPNGDRIWATYYGGDEADYAFNVDTDLAGNVFISGTTASDTGMAYNGYQNEKAGMGFTDDYVAKFDPIGNRVWATYYGGIGYDTHGLGSPEELGGISTDAAGNVYLAGSTSSQTGIASGGFQNERVGHGNLYLAKFDSIGTRLCATYFGKGPLSESYPCVVTDPFGHGYLGGVSNSQAPGLEYNGFQNTPGGGEDSYLVKFTTCGELEAGIIPVSQPCSQACEGIQQVSPSGGTPPYTFSWNTSPAQTSAEATNLCPGSYEIVVTDALDSVLVMQTTVLSGSTQPISISDVGDTLYASSASSYQWYLNNVVIPGATDQSYQVTVSGNYHVEGLVGGCFLSSLPLEMTCICITGIEENNEDIQFTFYPNPTTDKINVEFVQPFEGELNIVDAVGRLIYAEPVSRKTAISLAIPEPVGIYLIQLIQVNGTVTYFKIIKK